MNITYVHTFFSRGYLLTKAVYARMYGMEGRKSKEKERGKSRSGKRNGADGG